MNNSPAKLRIPRGVLALGMVSALMDISSEMIHSLLPVFLVTVLGASALTVGIIEGIAESTALITKIFSGMLSDYWGKRKPLALFGYALGAASKPLFAIAAGVHWVFLARFIDRIGKGIRGAPRDALVADITPLEIRGRAFGLRQAMDTTGALLGPLLAVGLMWFLANDFRTVFWIAVIPAVLAVIVLLYGVKEPTTPIGAKGENPLRLRNLRRLPSAFWWVVGIGGLVTLARFSEAFLILRVQEGGLAITLIPLVLVVFNGVYAATAYPFGHLSDRVNRRGLLAAGLVVLIAADIVLASSNQGVSVWIGIGLWGLHMGMTQGLLATLVAETAPAAGRGTAFGLFNFVSGIAMLIASVMAGLLWDVMGAPATFIAGAVASAMAIALIAVARKR